MKARRQWRRDAGALVLFVSACAVIAAAQLTEFLLRSWAAWVLLAAAAGAVGYRLGKRRSRVPSRPPKVIQGHAEDAEVIRLRAEAGALRAERDEARESAARAWDASTEPAPRSARDRLLSDRLSGVHDLFGRDQ